MIMAADSPQKRPGKKLAAAIRQYLLHERGMYRLLYNGIFCIAHIASTSHQLMQMRCQHFGYDWLHICADADTYMRPSIICDYCFTCTSEATAPLLCRF